MRGKERKREETKSEERRGNEIRRKERLALPRSGIPKGMSGGHHIGVQLCTSHLVLINETHRQAHTHEQAHTHGQIHTQLHRRRKSYYMQRSN